MLHRPSAALAFLLLCLWALSTSNFQEYPKGLFALYGWYKAVSTIHDYRKANINSNWVENGMNALVVHAEKSSLNTIHDAGCSFWFAASCVSIIGLVPNALIIFGS